MHAMLQKKRPAVTGAVDHGNGAGAARLIMSIAIPSIALWRENQPGPGKRDHEVWIGQRTGLNDDTETPLGQAANCFHGITPDHVTESAGKKHVNILLPPLWDQILVRDEQR